MMLFGKKDDKNEKKPVKDDLRDLSKTFSNKPVGFTKPRKFLFFKTKAKPVFAQQQPNASPAPAKQAENSKYINKIVSRKKDLQMVLREADVKKTPYEFAKSMVIYSALVSVALAAAIIFRFYSLFTYEVVAGALVESVLFGVVMGGALYNVLLNKFLGFPEQKLAKIGKLIERDILFAARDLVISMRSGMPLFNAMTAVSTGYGAASKEFSKVVDLIQLGMPIEQAMEEVSDKSKSKTFKRLMLQASVSIKAGVDVSGALQEVVSDVTTERVIELRRYGQKLNALAMFYMLFGVIFPSMGIAVATILTTFISIFTINFTMLMIGLAGIATVQLLFLNMMRTSRPTFAL